MRWTLVLLAAISAGLLGLLLLFPAAQHDPAPPSCFDIFSYQVPCGFTASAVTASGLPVFVATVAVARRFKTGSGR